MKKRWRRLARSALALVSGAALSLGSGALAQISPARPDVTRPPSDSATRKAQLCPRERTVLAAAQLVDEAGVSIGALADGAVVTLLDAPKPADGNRVRVAAEKSRSPTRSSRFRAASWPEGSDSERPPGPAPSQGRDPCSARTAAPWAQPSRLGWSVP